VIFSGTGTGKCSRREKQKQLFCHDPIRLRNIAGYMPSGVYLFHICI
jgi:hypothetical protein